MNANSTRGQESGGETDNLEYSVTIVGMDVD